MDPASHPDRARVLAELHARPFTPVVTPNRVLHFAFLVSAAEANHDRDRIETLVDDGSRSPGWLEDKRHLSLQDGHLRWERHGEFVSYTVCVPLDAEPQWPDNLTPPGPLLVAVDLRLIGEGMQPVAMVQASIVDGRALVSTDFSPSNRGFVDITITNRGMTDEVAGATVQRTLEIETYRCLALLGLPVAEKAAKAMGAIEHELPMLMQKMDECGFRGDGAHHSEEFPPGIPI